MNPETLRAEALQVLGPHGDPRARGALVHAELSVELAVASWEGTAGRVRAHRVVLLLDTARLAAVRTSPAVHDALCAAVASAVSARAGESLAELAVYWNGCEDEPTAGYRAAPPRSARGSEPDALRRALGSYLLACDEGPAAAIAARAELELEPLVAATAERRVTLRIPRDDRQRLTAEPRLAHALEDALRAVAARPESPRVVVALRARSRVD